MTSYRQSSGGWSQFYARSLGLSTAVTSRDLLKRLIGWRKTAISVEQVITDAETTGRGYLTTWIETTQHNLETSEADLIDLISPCVSDPAAVKAAIESILSEFAKKLTAPDAQSDFGEDMAAWKELSRDISGHIGRNAPLDQFLQELQMRSKEPTRNRPLSQSNDSTWGERKGIRLRVCHRTC